MGVGTRMKEVWKDIPGYEGLYQVSNLGGVRGLVYQGKPRVKWVKPYSGFWGRPKVQLFKHKKNTLHPVSRLVLSAFVGLPPKGYQAAHLDGNPLNDRLDNLKWCSPKENNSHKFMHGTMQHGFSSPGSKFSRETFALVEKMLGMGVSQYEIAEVFNVNQSTISRIKTRARWKHI